MWNKIYWRFIFFADSNHLNLIRPTCFDGFLLSVFASALNRMILGRIHHHNDCISYRRSLEWIWFHSNCSDRQRLITISQKRMTMDWLLFGHYFDLVCKGVPLPCKLKSILKLSRWNNTMKLLGFLLIFLLEIRLFMIGRLNLPTPVVGSICLFSTRYYECWCWLHLSKPGEGRPVTRGLHEYHACTSCNDFTFKDHTTGYI